MHACLLSHLSCVSLRLLDCSPPGSSVHGIFHARMLEWVAVASSRGSPWPRGQTHISYVFCLFRWVLYGWYHLRSPMFCSSPWKQGRKLIYELLAKKKAGQQWLRGQMRLLVTMAMFTPCCVHKACDTRKHWESISLSIRWIFITIYLVSVDSHSSTIAM